MESLTLSTGARKYVLEVSELSPFISWNYFYWAWGVAGAGEDVKRSIREDAVKMLDEWERIYKVRILLLRMPANSDGDDIIIGESEDVKLPMLRQQKPPFLCLADYIRPIQHGIKDEIGVFCTSVDEEIEHRYADDEYQRMLSQTLADRLAEAAAEKVSEMMPGVRPAVGYPVMPDMSLNFILDDLLDMRQIGVRLTESGMMRPHASVSGLVITHPKAQYFNIGDIGEDQLLDYARRRGVSLDKIRRYIKSKSL